MSTTYEAARMSALASQEAIVTAQKVMAESVKDAILLGLDPIFAQYPFLGAVGWSQYTPYFNDGDPCVFSTHIEDASCLSVVDVENFAEAGWGENGPDFYSKEAQSFTSYYPARTETPNENWDAAYAKASSDVREFLHSLRGGEPAHSYDDPTPSTFDMALLRAFGDHSQITIYRDGRLDVDEYEHD